MAAPKHERVPEQELSLIRAALRLYAEYFGENATRLSATLAVTPAETPDTPGALFTRRGAEQTVTLFRECQERAVALTRRLSDDEETGEAPERHLAWIEGES